METPKHYLSIRQPFASAIVEGHKDIENRSWPTHFRGRVYIHAGQSKTHLAKQCAYLEEEFGLEIDTDALVFGAIIGSVEIVDCATESDSPWFDGEGYGFVLRKPRMLKTPVLFSANVGIRPLPANILRKLK
jgi:hypothetical protein